MASEAVVELRGTSVRIREGDLLVTRSSNASSYVIALTNHGYSHITTAVRVGGSLCAVGVLSRGWTDAQGVRHPPGITCEPLALYNDPIYTRLWIVRPRVPRTVEQTMRLRLEVADHLRRKAGDAHAYDSAREFLHSAAGWPAHTTDRHHCAEWAAHLVKASGDGAWPDGQTTSVPIHVVVQLVGEPERVF